jgi:hypothetical protein
MSTYEIEANGTLMGEYSASTADAALEAYASDAGYDSYSDLPGKGEETVNLIDAEALCAAIEAKTGQPVFQDSYGDGVAESENQSFQTYRTLADHYELSLSAFYA